MDLPYRPHNLEAAQLKLTTEHFPLPRSLRPQVLEKYGQGPAVAEHQALSEEDLLDYLRRNEDHQGLPLQALQDQLDAMGDPAEPSTEQRAILQWMGNALQAWEDGYPLAQPLAQSLKPLRSLASALAITDAIFLQPGAHPLHQFLDELVMCAIGWHPQLGRAGDALLKRTERAAGELLEWFTDMDTDLAAISDEFCRDCERDRKRAQRMSRRTAETEVGRAKALDARRQAALMINDNLAQHKAPEEVGEFLKGPWFASAQLVLLKFGENSSQWAGMTDSTWLMLQSLQPPEEINEEQRREMFEAATRTPRDLKRWLLSLHHDSAAADEAVSQIEFAQMRLLRQQPLELQQIAPIETEGAEARTSDRAETLQAIREGQWFAIDVGDGIPQRVHLTLNLQQQQKLVFTNHVGLKALELDYARFEELLTQRLVKRLHYHASFSSCLAGAAGIDSVEALQQLLSVGSEDAGSIGTLEMGAWLGFHDGDTPMLAKVAVHDQQSNRYTFVNREGIKLRELSGDELASLMERGLVDVLEARSSFRGQVRQTREDGAGGDTEN
jgi:hypothetical protein